MIDRKRIDFELPLISLDVLFVQDLDVGGGGEPAEEREMLEGRSKEGFTEEVVSLDEANAVVLAFLHRKYMKFKIYSIGLSSSNLKPLLFRIISLF